MNCQTFRTIVHEIDLPEGLEASALDAALGHAQDCSRCARQLYQARGLVGSLQALARADRKRQASPYSEARLLEAFRAQQTRGRTVAWTRAWTGWLAAAAALLLAAGAGLLWHRASSAARRAPLRAAVSVSAPPSSPAQLPPALTVPPPSRSASVSPGRPGATRTGKP